LRTQWEKERSRKKKGKQGKVVILEGAEAGSSQAFQKSREGIRPLIEHMKGTGKFFILSGQEKEKKKG